VLDWFGNIAESDDDELPNPPFQPELMGNWFLERRKGTGNRSPFRS